MDALSAEEYEARGHFDVLVACAVCGAHAYVPVRWFDFQEQAFCAEHQRDRTVITQESLDEAREWLSRFRTYMEDERS